MLITIRTTLLSGSTRDGKSTPSSSDGTIFSRRQACASVQPQAWAWQANHGPSLPTASKPDLIRSPETAPPRVQPSQKRSTARCAGFWLTVSSRSRACHTARQLPEKTPGFLRNHPCPGRTSIQHWPMEPTVRKPYILGPASSRPFSSIGMMDGKARTCSS